MFQDQLPLFELKEKGWGHWGTTGAGRAPVISRGGRRGGPLVAPDLGGWLSGHSSMQASGGLPQGALWEKIGVPVVLQSGQQVPLCSLTPADARL